jgi:hypothetical protein
MDHHILTIDDQPCISPREVAAGSIRQGFPADFWGRANSISLSIGFEPGEAWLLVPRSSWNLITPDNLHDLTWSYFRAGVQYDLELSDWVLCDARLVGIDGDDKAPYLCQLRDVRQLLKMGGTVDVAYNVSVPCPAGTEVDGRRYLSGTLNSGAVWTWQQMLDDLWAELPGVLAGTAPTLPWTPPHSPDSWRFHGVPAWEAIRQVFDACQATVKLGNAGGFTAVDLGTAQSFNWSQAPLPDRILRDEEPYTLSRAMRPASFRVSLPARMKPHCCEDWINRHNEQPIWLSDPIATGFTNAQADTEQVVRYDLVAELCGDTVTDELDLKTSAEDIAGRLVDRMTVCTELLKVHAGICQEPALGSEIHEILYADYGDVNGCTTTSKGIAAWGFPRQAVTQPIRDLPLEIVELCCVGDHPGPDEKFDLKKGCWDPATDRFCYDDAVTVKGIDHRHGMVYPGDGARGLFMRMCSDTTDDGSIYVLLTWDCESSGACPLCEGS